MFDDAHIPHPFGIHTDNITDVQSAARIGAANTGKHHMRKGSISGKS